MEINFLTFHHLVNDSLSPHNSEFNDDKKIRSALGFLLNSNSDDSNNYFSVLPNAIKYSNINVNNKILIEWRELSVCESNDKLSFIESCVNENNWESIRLKFFMLLCGFYCVKCLTLLDDKILEEDSMSLKKLYVMQSLKILSQLIVDGKENIADCNEIKQIKYGVIIFIAFAWKQIYVKHMKLVSLTGLSILPEEVKMYLFDSKDYCPSIKNLLEKMYSFLYKKEETYNTKTDNTKTDIENDKIIIEDIVDKNTSINDLIKSVSSDVNQLKNACEKYKNIPKKNTKKEYLNPAVAREILNISKTTLCAWRKKGKFKDYKKLGNKFVYSRIEIENMARQG